MPTMWGNASWPGAHVILTWHSDRTVEKPSIRAAALEQDIMRVLDKQQWVADGHENVRKVNWQYAHGPDPLPLFI